MGTIGGTVMLATIKILFKSGTVLSSWNMLNVLKRIIVKKEKMLDLNEPYTLYHTKEVNNA